MMSADSGASDAPDINKFKTASAPIYPGSAGPDSHVETLRLDWFDGARDRKLPVKIYYPKSGTAPHPIILFSHGLGASREDYGYLARFLASHGYIQLHLQHAGS